MFLEKIGVRHFWWWFVANLDPIYLRKIPLNLFFLRLLRFWISLVYVKRGTNEWGKENVDIIIILVQPTEPYFQIRVRHLKKIGMEKSNDYKLTENTNKNEIKLLRENEKENYLFVLHCSIRRKWSKKFSETIVFFAREKDNRLLGKHYVADRYLYYCTTKYTNRKMRTKRRQNKREEKKYPTPFFFLQDFHLFYTKLRIFYYRSISYKQS